MCLKVMCLINVTFWYPKMPPDGELMLTYRNLMQYKAYIMYSISLATVDRI